MVQANLVDLIFEFTKSANHLSSKLQDFSGKVEIDCFLGRP